MPVFRVEVHPRHGADDPIGQAVLQEITQLGAAGVHAVRVSRVFLLEGPANVLSEAAVHRVARELLTDPVSERYVLGHEAPAAGRMVEVHLKPGVMDPVADSAQAAIADLLDQPYDAAAPVVAVRTGRRYALAGHLTAESAKNLARRLLANESIESVYYEPYTPAAFPRGARYDFHLIHVPIRNLADDQLAALSRTGHLFLDLAEMRAVQQYFRQQERDPTDAELETIAQTWSEHCVHKTLKARIEFFQDGHGPDAAGTDRAPQIIDNLVKSTIFRATQELALPWALSVFKDNAGVIALDDDYAVCMKVETHNRPSAIEPYGGAATGIGGCIRDVIGTGAGARPFASTDVFCFAPPDTPENDVPAGVIHPRRTAQRVVAGVRDYGNRMGIPTVNGAVFFDKRYIGNPLVFCGTAGVLPIKFAQKGAAQAGDRIVLVGGRTGRDGIHGATFSSAAVGAGHAQEFSHAVQIGNAITEKKLLDVILQARDHADGPLFRAITDCGAGGLSSAIGEMGEQTGATVALDKAPLKYDGLSYSEIWISEAQERMVLAAPPDRCAALLALCAAEDVEATDLGVFDGSGLLTLYYQEHCVGKLNMHFLHHGVPMPTRAARYTPPALEEPLLTPPQNFGEELHGLLALPTIASKHWIIRQYDHEVQGGTIVRPLVGPRHDGPSDAAVVRPLLDRAAATVLAVGGQFRFGDLDPYQMALNGMDEAIRNVICVGGTLDRIALLDNFCWPKCDDPRHLGALVRACQACYDGAKAFGTPFISGKDSLSNEFIAASGQVIRIPYTLLISAIGVIGNGRNALTMDAKAPGNLLVAVGITRRELGGSHYYARHGALGARVPVVDLPQALATHRAVESVIREGHAVAAHDASEGGLAVCLAEMLFAGGRGANINLADVPCGENAAADEVLMFSESASRYVLEIPPQRLDAARRLLKNVRHGVLGAVTERPHLKVKSVSAGLILDEPVDALKKSWRAPLDW